MTAAKKKSNILRARIATVLKQASVEKNKPIPKQFVQLQIMLEKLQHSRKEQLVFFDKVEAILKARGEMHFINLIEMNRKRCKDGSYLKEQKEERRKHLAEDKDRRIGLAKVKLEMTARGKLEALARKMKKRESMRKDEKDKREKLARQSCWIVVLKLASHVAKVKPVYLKERGRLKLATKERVLANKIVNMWKVKKAPTKGKLYRECVKKLRSFIKNKTSQWKQAQKTRATDLLIVFLKEHRRANLPIVVANFIKNVKVWQRWWREYDQATKNRLKAMLMMWDEVEAEWFKEEEDRLHSEAEEKKRLEKEFDLDSVLGAGDEAKLPAYAKGIGKLRGGASSPTNTPGTSRPKPPAKSRRRSALTSSSPNASKRKQHSKLNMAQASVIIDLRLQKDLQAMREKKPQGYVKRELLKQKLREIRRTFKMGLPGYLEMVCSSDVAAQKICTIKDVKLVSTDY